jgi:hypothetical protein
MTFSISGTERGRITSSLLHLVVLKDKPDSKYLELDFEHVMILNTIYVPSLLCVHAKHY